MPSSKFFRATADAFVRRGLRAAGYEYLQIDDCWMAEARGPDGEQIVDATKFPEGMLNLSDYIHSLDLKIGIYTATGEKTCAQHAGSCGAFTEDAAEYVAWEMDYLKVDSCGGCSSPYVPGGGSMNDTEALRAALDASPHGANIWMQVHPSTNITAVSADPARYGNSRIPGRDMFESWTSLVSAIDWAAGLWRFAHNDKGRGGFWNELDLLIGMGDFEETTKIRTFFGMAVIMKSALILSTDITKLSDEAIDVITNPEAIAINQDLLGEAGRRIASVAPRNTTLAAPFDALLVIQGCNASRPTQLWRLNTTDGSLWTADAHGKRWCVGPQELAWTRPLSVLPCDDPAYRRHTAAEGEGVPNFVSAFEATCARTR